MSTSADEIIEALRASLTENEQLRHQNEELLASAREPIAVVSMSCRFPGGATSPEALWRFLLDEGDAVSGFPENRGWPPDSGHGAEAAFLSDPDQFDPSFFGISPREALTMDPQQRLLLETSWETLERAGVVPATLKNSLTGVYMGATATTYTQGATEEVKGSEGHLVTGVGFYSIAGRLAYTYGLQGPAVTIDTACSSSLVAIHHAVQALRAGECTLALAGGATVLASPEMFVGISSLDVLTFSGRCRAFAGAADGTAFSEGIGVLLLERLSDARRNGHNVLAVIRGTAVNHDGPSNGLTAPNGRAQRRVIQQALANAQLTPDQVDAVEAHGTGTTLGDPIEAHALLATYGQQRTNGEPLWLASIKSNIGHTLAAAGVAGVVKMVEALRHGVLPKTLHVDEPSPQVDWSTGDVRLLEDTRPWPEHGRPRRAGVSSFGISGTNAHLILEQAPEQAVPSTAEQADEGRLRWQTPVVPWVISAKTEAALRAQAERLADFATDRPDLDIAAVGAALTRHRAAFDQRAVAVAADRGELIASLRALAADEPAPQWTRGAVGKPSRVVFVFPGQGAQWEGMGRELLATSSDFAAAIADCEAAFAGQVDWSLTEVLTRAPGAPDLSRVDVVQPVSFAVMVALAAVWRAHGIEPAAVVGHSQGEIAAAHVAGALSLKDAARIVIRRSAAIVRLAGRGAMASVNDEPDAVAARIAPWGGRLSLAAVNGPRATVVAGEPAAVSELLAACEADGVRARAIAVDYASHSPQVEEIEQEIREPLADITPIASPVLFCSTVTGEPLGTAELDAGYWYRNLRQPVQFETAVRHLVDLGHHTFIEVSSHPVLRLGLTETFEQAGAPAVALQTLRRDSGGPRQFLLAMAEAHTIGLPVDWEPVLPAPPVGLDLPTYAFQRERYWIAPSSARVGDLGSVGIGEAGHPLLSALVALAEGDTVVLTGCISRRAQPWLAGHAVGGTVLVPGAVFAELAVRAGDEVGHEHLHELTLETPLVLDEHTEVQIQLRVGPPDGAGGRPVSIHSRDRAATGVPWTRHASGILTDAVGAVSPEPVDGTWPPTGAQAVETSGFYQRLAEAGYQYGAAFRGLRAAWRRGDEVFAEVELPEEQREEAAGFGIHPALLDAVLHAGLLSAAGRDGADDDAPVQVHLPFVWNRFALSATGATLLRVRAVTAEDGALTVSATDPVGRPVLAVDSILTRPAELGGSDRLSQDLADSLFRVEWTDPGATAGGALEADIAVIAPRDSGLVPDLGAAPVHEDLAALAAAVDGGRPVPDTVLLPCPPPRTDADSLPDPARVQAAVLDVLGVLQDWLADERWGESRLVVVTRGAVGLAAGTGVEDMAAAAVRGLVRSALAEHPERFGLVDVGADGAGWDTLGAALALGENEVVAGEDGRVLVPRLRRMGSGGGLVLPGSDGWQLEVGRSGSLDDVTLVETPAAWDPLGPGQVRIRVRAAGLNFRDVVVALGMLPGQDDTGAEAAGVVVEVGPGVERLAVGDRVMGLMPGAFSSVGIVDERLMVPVPPEWSWDVAASLPIAFATAWFGLGDLAGLAAGQTVLVHAGAGGVGMAAVQLARWWGAEVFATAHPSKWDVLRGLGLDDDHIASSRELGFEEKFRTVSNGRGVDVVLNSLAGEFVDASLRLLAPGGRFLEMGKTDKRSDEQVAVIRTDVAYRAFDLPEAGEDRLNEILRELVDALGQGHLTPLPVRARDIRRAPEVFRWMAQGRHVGKNVLRVPGPLPAAGSVLITGGTGTLGRLVARHLIERHGVGHVILVSRRGADAPGAEELRKELEELGGRVTLAACDTTDRDKLAALIAQIPEDLPLVGVVHAAGVLEDGMISTLGPDQVERVLRPKLDAALHLHELTADMDLQWFVLFSSAAGLFGGAGQANYSAANTFLDALAYHRQSLGLPAVSLAWGHWGQASGMTGHLTEADHKRMARSGIVPITNEQGLALLDAALRTDEPLLLTAVLNLTAFGGGEPQQIPPIVRGLVRPARRQAAGEEASFADRLASLPAAERAQQLTDMVRAQAATVLGHGAVQAVDPERGFTDLGFDSLTAVELRNRLTAATGLRLPATLIFDYPTPAALAGMLLSQLAPADTTSSEASQDFGEADIRRALATVPFEQFEKAGIADILIRLARGEDHAGDDGAPDQSKESIAAMSADDLIHLVLGDTES
ncbi:type I polyketide synthase [Streptomyces sp. MP131-18]|uniref:type I polyketide synthase n=1 Tax=Streptomyces sp. MP131-18 TaxID=1857892 RepID=UPI00097CAF90|nr:type I polyketide synthase [Streptomyces sp. MP131-18]ONK10088.1 Erythronolide synthase, modules 3 and 4 [Streptomyces sp. MP131-18]